MTSVPVERRKGYTWDDYRSWRDDKRWEIIGGEAFDMTPAPAVRHQSISSELMRLLLLFFNKQRPCRVFAAPIDVKLSEEDVVQPDIVVVCNRDQMKETHIEGPPTLVVEILSPGSLRHDRVRKMELYAKSGVKEFWLVTSDPPLVEVFLLDGRSYRLHGGYVPDETLRSPIFPKMKLALAGVFDFPGTPPTRGKRLKEAVLPYGAPLGARRRGPAHYRRP